jgi:hypothetical protein
MIFLDLPGEDTLALSPHGLQRMQERGISQDRVRTENLLAACRRCNSQKNRKTLEEWVATGRAPKGVGKRLARVDT